MRRKRTEWIFQREKLLKSDKRIPGHGNEKKTLRETDSLLTSVENNATRINYIKTKIDNTQQNNIKVKII